VWVVYLWLLLIVDLLNLDCDVIYCCSYGFRLLIVVDLVVVGGSSFLPLLIVTRLLIWVPNRCCWMRSLLATPVNGRCYVGCW